MTVLPSYFNLLNFYDSSPIVIHRALRSLNLPSSLEALDTPIGLPPSLLQKAEEVRIEEGPTRIETSIEDVQRLAQHDVDILDEVLRDTTAVCTSLTCL